MQAPDLTIEHLAQLPKGHTQREDRRAAVEAALCLTKAYGLPCCRPAPIRRTGTSHIAGRAAVYFLRGRLRFGDGGNSAPFPSASALWGAGPETLEALDATLPGAWRAG